MEVGTEMTSLMKHKLHFNFRGRGEKALSNLSSQAVLGWVGLAAFILGVAFLGWAAAAGLDAHLRHATLKSLESRAALPVDHLTSAGQGGPAGVELKRFTEANPFHADLPPGGAAVQTLTETKANGTSLGDLTLIGTLPPEGAFFSSGSGTVLLLRGDEVDGYELAEVRPDGVLFHKGEEEIFLHIQFAGNGPKTGVGKPSNSGTAPATKHNIQAATPEKEGALDRELVNQLLMNPFEELKRLRLRPRMENGEAVGIEVRYIRKDSIFKQLGVTRGDVIQGVNGIQMRSMNDVANAISSLMGGSRFDVTVLRDGNPVTLSYTVR